MIKMSDLLILGIGNYLMGDEGVGVHTALALQKLPIAETIDVVDGGTGGFHLLEFFEIHDKVILIDATLDNNEPGTIRLIKPKFAIDFPRAMSTHDIGLRDMVNALQLMDKMPEIYLFVVSIESIQQQGIELTAAIEKAIPNLIEKVLELANQLQEKSVLV
ncbi:MAG: hydrogenase maturation protease [Bacteroidota bacterium]